MSAPDSSYTINSINPWRMLLFGSAGALLPIALYLISFEFFDATFKNEHKDLLMWLLIPVLILSVLGGYYSFKLSTLQLEIFMNEQGLSIIKKPRLFILPVSKISLLWQDLHNYSITEDTKGKVLEIMLHNKKKITIGCAEILNDDANFDAFYSTFLIHLNRFNELGKIGQNTFQSIEKVPGFYQSKTGKMIAYLLLILMLMVLVLFFVSDQPFNRINWLKFIFFELLSGFYVWRSLMKKA